jgi:hypothetical protein
MFNFKRKNKIQDISAPETKFVEQERVNNEVIAALAMGLHIYLNAYRDEESEVITIDMPSARYSPWALKILVMKRVMRK